MTYNTSQADKATLKHRGIKSRYKEVSGKVTTIYNDGTKTVHYESKNGTATASSFVASKNGTAPAKKAPAVNQIYAPAVENFYRLRTDGVFVLITEGSSTFSIKSTLTKAGFAADTVGASSTLTEMHELYMRATHIIFTGGSDIHPGHYGEEVDGASVSRQSILRDEIELILARRAIVDGKPTWGICRGHQLLCVAAGGKLIQDVKGHTSNVHKTRLVKGSRLQKTCVYEKLIRTNSYHHQVVDWMPDGWKIVATSEEGFVEGMEHKELPIVGTQWHPEMESHTDRDIAFLNGLLTSWNGGKS